MSEQTAVPRKLWAVVVIGTKMPNGLPAYLSKDGNSFFPVLVYTHRDRAKAERRMKSLESANRAVKFFDGPGMSTNSPFFGVVEVTLPPKKPGRKVSPEQVAAMQAGRKASQAEKTEPPAAKHTSRK